MPNLIFISEDLRLTAEDTSMLTRASLYESIWEGIASNYYIIAHGPNACVAFIQNPNRK